MQIDWLEFIMSQLSKSTVALLVSFCFCPLLDLFLTSSSLSSANERNFWRLRPDRNIWWSDVSVSSKEPSWKYWRSVMIKYMKRARVHAIPHMRNNPQKLVRWSLSDSISSVSEMQPALVNHFSCILWSSPFSDKVSIAVDKSTDRGESLGKT